MAVEPLPIHDRLLVEQQTTLGSSPMGLKDYQRGWRFLVTRTLVVLLGALAISINGGCRFCCDTEDLAYPTYGGSWERTRRNEGRVGSLFDPGGAMVANLSDREDVIPPDERDRARTKAESDSDDDSVDATDDPSQKEMDSDLEKKIERLRGKNLEDINIIPGEPLPPSIH